MIQHHWLTDKPAPKSGLSKRETLRQELQLRSGFGSKRIYGTGFKPLQPIVDEVQHGGEIEPLVSVRKPSEICVSQFEKRGSRPQPPLLQMDEGTSQLDEAFVKQAIRIVPLRKPQVLQHIMSLVEELPVKTIEIPEVMRVQIPSTILLDGGRYSRTLVTHTIILKSKAQSLKSKV